MDAFEVGVYAHQVWRGGHPAPSVDRQTPLSVQVIQTPEGVRNVDKEER